MLLTNAVNTPLCHRITITVFSLTLPYNHNINKTWMCQIECEPLVSIIGPGNLQSQTKLLDETL